MRLHILPATFAICRFPAAAPPFNPQGSLYSITCTEDECTVIVEQQLAPSGVQREDGWRALKVEGPLDFALTGIFASIATPLADAGISIFALSTFDTDYVLVKEAALEAAIDALSAAGHRIDRLFVE